MNREARLQSARGWLRTYRGRDLVRGYRKWYGVSTVCAIIELRMIGVPVSDERLTHANKTEEEAARQRTARKQIRSAGDDTWSDSDDCFALIAGYTEGGAPYGLRWDETEQTAAQDGQVVCVVTDRDEGNAKG